MQLTRLNLKLKFILSPIAVPIIYLTTATAQAQTNVPASTSQIQQPGVFSNSNNSSRQFFQQGRDKLYFLEESDDVLEIDEDISQEAEDSDSIETEENQSEPIESEQSK